MTDSKQQIDIEELNTKIATAIWQYWTTGESFARCCEDNDVPIYFANPFSQIIQEVELKESSAETPSGGPS